MRRVVLVLAGLVLATGFGLGLYVVSGMEATERDQAGEWQRLTDLEVIDHHQLVVVDLAEGQRVFFEVCSEEGFQDAAWVGSTRFDIVFVEAGEVARSEVATPELLERTQRNEVGAGCLVVASADALGVSGEYGLGVGWDALPEALREREVRGRILAWTPVGMLGRVAVYAVLLGTLLLMLGLLLPARKPTEFDAAALEVTERKTSKLGGPTRVAIGVGGLIVTIVALGVLPFGGASAGLLRALAIAGAELALAWALVRGLEQTKAEALGLVKPRFGIWVLLPAPIVGAALWLGGGLLMQLVPSTGEAPIETFVSFPSGSLAVGVIATFVPFAEELFFRGFVYGELERKAGAAAATASTVVLFAVAHLPQQWGAWGAFASVTVTGLVLTVLRWAGKSTLLPAVAHVAHNAIITILSV